MAGKGGVPKSKDSKRKRVEVDQSSSASLVRAKNGSAFTKCDECNKDVPVALISFHNCSLDARIKMNLEAQLVENAPEVKQTSTKKTKTKSTDAKAKKEKKTKDPNMPKRPPTAFFVFMEEFRKSYKEANPDCKKVSMVAKEGGEKWKLLTDEEKKPYQDKAAELKAEYEKAKECNNDAGSDDDEGKPTTENELKVETVSDDE